MFLELALSSLSWEPLVWHRSSCLPLSLRCLLWACLLSPPSSRLPFAWPLLLPPSSLPPICAQERPSSAHSSNPAWACILLLGLRTPLRVWQPSIKISNRTYRGNDCGCILKMVAHSVAVNRVTLLGISCLQGNCVIKARSNMTEMSKNVARGKVLKIQ